MREIVLNNQDRMKTFTDAKALLETVQGVAKHPLFQKDFFGNIICLDDEFVWRKDVIQNRVFKVIRLTPKQVHGMVTTDTRFLEWKFKAEDVILTKEK